MHTHTYTVRVRLNQGISNELRPEQVQYFAQFNSSRGTSKAQIERGTYHLGLADGECPAGDFNLFSSTVSSSKAEARSLVVEGSAIFAPTCTIRY